MTVKQIITETVHKFPLLKRHTQKPPFRFNQHVWHILWNGEKRAATVGECSWQSSVYNPATHSDGAWLVHIAFYPFENGEYDDTRIWESWVDVKELEAA